MDFSDSLKNFCSDIDTVIDYFLIVGLSQRTIQSYIQNRGPVQPEILSQFPNFTRKENQLPQQIQTVNSKQFLCPFNLKIVDGATRAQGSVYATVISNPIGEKIYCSCLRFYQAYSPDSDQQSIKIQEAKGFQSHFQVLKKPSCDDLQTITRTSNSFDTPTPSRYSLFGPGKLLVPKSLVLVSRAPFFRTCKIILKELYDLFCTQLNFPIELYISQLVLEVPMPPKGQTQVLYQLMKRQVKFSLPPCNKLPILDLNVGLVFHVLDFWKIMTIFNCLSLQKSIIFISNDQKKILEVSQIFISFLHPFHWTMIYVPLLPQSIMFDLLGSPVNFVYGANIIHKQQIICLCQPKTSIVDLDNNEILEGRNRFSLTSSSNQELPSISHHYGRKLIDKLQELLRKSGGKKPNFRLPTKKIDPFTANSIRNLFLQFYVGIFQNYKKYLIFDQNSQTLFDKTGFLHHATEHSKAYLAQLTKTQMFANFVQSRINPQTVQEYCQNLFFDQTVSAKHNRSHFKRNKLKTPFINDTSQNHYQKYQVRPIYSQHRPKFTYTYQKFPLFDLAKLEQYGIPATPTPKLTDNTQLPVENFTITTAQCKTDRACVLVCWFQMWAACLHQQQQRDLQTRLDQLLKILKKVQNIPGQILSKIYKLLLQVTNEVNPHLSIPIYQTMCQTSVMMDAATIQVLQKIIQKLRGKKSNIVMKSTGHSLQLANIMTEQAAHQQFIKKKVHTRRLDQRSSIDDNIRFEVDENCMNCGEKIGLEDVRNGWRRIQTDYESECPNCRIGFFPNLKVYVWDGEEQKSEEVLFASPQVLRSLVAGLLAHDQNKLGLNLGLFRRSNSIIFWNLIWHFSSMQLPYYFMMSCEENSIIAHHQNNELLFVVQE